MCFMENKTRGYVHLILFLDFFFFTPNNGCMSVLTIGGGECPSRSREAGSFLRIPTKVRINRETRLW